MEERMTDVTERADPTAEEQSTATQVKDTVQEGVREAKDRALETTQQVRGQAADRVREQVDQRSTQAGQQATSIADAMRRTGEQLRSEGNDQPAKLTDAVAERAERLGTYMTNANADQILRDAEDFGRRQPWLFAVGGLALGFLASRFVKASSSRRANDAGVYRSGMYGYASTSPALTGTYSPSPLVGPNDELTPMSDYSDPVGQ